MKFENITITQASDTGIQIASLHDPITHTTVRTALPGRPQSASTMAYVGARFSRSDKSSEELFREIFQAGTDSQKRLATIFRGYGHASVADMAQLFVYIENIPKLYDARFFYETSLGGGQGRSSRYQDYEKSNPISLSELALQPVDDTEGEALFTQLQTYTLEKYAKWKHKLTDEFTKKYQVNLENKGEKSALQARVFDCARYFLTNGTYMKTSVAWVTSAREWARIISVFKADTDPQLQRLGEQIEDILAPQMDTAEYTPEAAELIKYTEADETQSSVHIELANYLHTHNFPSQENMKPSQQPQTVVVYSKPAGEMTLIQLISTIHPSASTEVISKWISERSEKELTELSSIILDSFTHHKQMGPAYRTNVLTTEMELTIAEGIDLNRHRAWGRFAPLLTSDHISEVVGNGYIIPAYLWEGEICEYLGDEFSSDMQHYYTEYLLPFIAYAEDKTWWNEAMLAQLIPLGHRMRLYMHASAKEVSYMTQLRVRPGGHINYRIAAWEIAEHVSKSETLLSGIQKLTKPNPSSREEFVDRS